MGLVRDADISEQGGQRRILSGECGQQQAQSALIVNGRVPAAGKQPIQRLGASQHIRIRKTWFGMRGAIERPRPDNFLRRESGMRYWRRTSLLLAVTLALGGLALAHEDDNRNRPYGGALDARQNGYQRGYRDGYHHGQQDRARRASYDYRGSDWKDADRGYEKSMGSKGQFKQGYREGYQRGYSEGYGNRGGAREGIYGRTDDRIYRDNDDRRGRQRDDDRRGGQRDGVYGNGGWGNQNVAYDFGHRDGLLWGRQDARNRKNYKLNDNSLYKKATNGYDDRYGDKDNYKRRYREGFERGYREGYGR